MILYTPLSREDIYQQELNHEAYSLIQYQDRLCYAEKLSDGQYRLLQLLSTDPNDFLEESFVPGTIIDHSIGRNF